MKKKVSIKLKNANELHELIALKKSKEFRKIYHDSKEIRNQYNKKIKWTRNQVDKMKEYKE